MTLVLQGAERGGSGDMNASNDISLVLSIHSLEWARLSVQALKGDGGQTGTEATNARPEDGDVGFAQFWRLADSTSLALAACGYKVLKVCARPGERWFGLHRVLEIVPMGSNRV